jgi:hypothetical protein
MNSIVVLGIVVFLIVVYFTFITYALIVKTKKVNDLKQNNFILQQKIDNVEELLEYKTLDCKSLSECHHKLSEDNAILKRTVTSMENTYLDMKGQWLEAKQRVGKQVSHAGYGIGGSAVKIYKKCKGWAIELSDNKVGYIAGYNKDGILIIGVNHACNSYYLPTAGDHISQREYVGYILCSTENFIFK